MMNKLDGLTLDLESTNKDKLRSVFPECFTEGQLDIDKLLSLCGEYITDDFEKYEFKWKGKSDCLRLAQKRSTATLRPVPGDSVNWDTTQNLYIEGDNLEVLKLLQKSYFRKVKMIYIDPPYNTGNDFVYEDDFADPLARYKEVTAQTTKSNPETMGRYHTNWLNMMYPRLRLAANLLRDDGVIFISIDDNEVDNLKKLCNEVFGEENFLSLFCWKTDGNFDNQAKIKICHQYILMYGKRANEFPPPPVIDPSISHSSKLYKTEIRNTIIKNGSKNPISDVSIPAGFPCDFENGIIYAQNVEWPKYNKDIRVVNGITTEEVIATTGWASKAQLVEYINNGFQYITDTKGQAAKFVITRTGAIEVIKNRSEQQSHVVSIISNLGGSQKASVSLGELAPFFDFPKPVELIKYFLQMNYGKDFICLDFFSGSATTAHAVMQLNAEDGGNRQFIMVQLPEVCDEKSEAARNGYPNICEIGKERIRRAGKKLTEAGKDIDTGFKVFRLDSSNLKLWDDTPIESGDLDSLFARMNGIIDNLKPGRSEDDLVYEILLKMGYPLTADVAALELDGLTVYTVEQNSMLICLQPGVTAEAVEKLAALKPQKIVLAENAVADNSAMSNAHYLLENRGIELKIF